MTDFDVVVRLDDLGRKVDELRNSVDAERGARERQIAAWERRAGASETAATEASVAAAAARRATRRSNVALVLVALLAFFGWRSNNDRVDAVVQQRTDSRVIACQQDNIFRVSHNQLSDALVALNDALAGIISLVNVPNPARTTDQQQTLDHFIDQSNALIAAARQQGLAAKLPIRDCSIEGVTRFYTTTTIPGG